MDSVLAMPLLPGSVRGAAPGGFARYLRSLGFLDSPVPPEALTEENAL